MVEELQLRVAPEVAFDERHLREYLSRERGYAPAGLTVRILKRSIDARQRRVMVNLKVMAYVDEAPDEAAYSVIAYRPVDGSRSAIVVGAGPGGLFAALRLIELGVKPVILERGKPVRERKVDIAQITRSQSVWIKYSTCSVSTGLTHRFSLMRTRTSGQTGCRG